jgi:hypothetical protein
MKYSLAESRHSQLIVHAYTICSIAKDARPTPDGWATLFILTADHIWDGFLLLSLLEDYQTQHTTLHVPHSGEHQNRFTEAVKAWNQWIQLFGQEELRHYCDKCTWKYKDTKGNGKCPTITYLENTDSYRAYCIHCGDRWYQYELSLLQPAQLPSPFLKRLIVLLSHTPLTKQQMYNHQLWQRACKKRPQGKQDSCLQWSWTSENWASAHSKGPSSSVAAVRLTTSQLCQAGINWVCGFSNHIATVTTTMTSAELQFQTGWNQSNLNSTNMNKINQPMPSVLQETVFYILTTIIYSKWKQI